MTVSPMARPEQPLNSLMGFRRTEAAVKPERRVAAARAGSQTGRPVSDPKHVSSPRPAEPPATRPAGRRRTRAQPAPPADPKHVSSPASARSSSPRGAAVSEAAAERQRLEARNSAKRDSAVHKHEALRRARFASSTAAAALSHQGDSFFSSKKSVNRARHLEAGGDSRWRDCHSPAPPSTFSRCFNRDKKGVSAE